jgi:anti-sigma factor RsiW
LSCQRARVLIDPYVDGELDPVQVAEVERHLDECKNCNLRYRNQLTLRSTFKDESLYYHAPQDLQKRIKASLQKEMNCKQRAVNRKIAGDAETKQR